MQCLQLTLRWFRERCVRRGEEAPAVRQGHEASGHPCSFSLGMRFCPIKTRPPTQKGPADRGAPLRLHGLTSLFLCSPRPLPPVAPPAQNQTPSGHLPASTTRGQCWLLAPLSLPLALTGSLGACPQGSHTASPWSSASPQGFWGEPRHSLPGEQSH